MRATLVWMDPPVLNFAGRQLLHDLDLVVLPIQGEEEGQPIFSNGRVECCDLLNNVERVVVPAVAKDAISPKKYLVRVMAFKLIDSEHQVGAAG
ncbi:unnamed protein product [Sphacelaria rigidula]